MLAAVAVMKVPIDNQDFFQAMFVPGIFGRQGDVIEQAESHGPIGFGMMPRRSGESKAVLNFSSQQGIDQGE